MWKNSICLKRGFLFMLFFIVFLGYAEHAIANHIQPFVKGSYQSIIEGNRGNDFVVVLWSVDCPPCLEELELIADIKGNSPNYKFILVAVDDYQDRESIIQLLNQYRVLELDNWIFAASNVDRLRFEIDPTWYGETPRSYLFRGDAPPVTLRKALTEPILSAVYGG